jgi:putative serine protease PepD
MTDDPTPRPYPPADRDAPADPYGATASNPAAPDAPRRHTRRGGALLLAAAVVAGGAAGGLVTSAVDGNASSTATQNAAVQRSGAAVEQTSAGTALSGTPESAAAAIRPSVVTVEVTGTQASGRSFDGGQGSTVSDTGSGVVLRSDGFVLTNNHVVAAAESGGSVHLTLANGRTVPATIVGHDATDDLAVLKATGVSGLTPAVFAPSAKLQVGQSVLAVGAPLGLANTVTQGIVSTLHRPVATGEPGASAQSVIDAVQTDAAINPGNSGGALVDLAGRVVGINSAIASTGGASGGGQSGNIGVGFAIPSDDAARVADQLIATGHATHSQIGIGAGNAVSTTDGAPGLGAAVREVSAGGPAARAGLQAGDVVTKLDDRVVTEANGLIVAVRSHEPGSTVTVTYLRGGATRTANVTLASAPSD